MLLVFLIVAIWHDTAQPRAAIFLPTRNLLTSGGSKETSMCFRKRYDFYFFLMTRARMAIHGPQVGTGAIHERPVFQVHGAKNTLDGA